MNFEKLPKSLKKAIRYIQQDAPLDKLDEIESYFKIAIERRKNSKK